MLARHRPSSMVTSAASSSKYVGAGARAAACAAVTTGSKAKRCKKGLTGPPMSTPVRAGQRAACPPGQCQ
eukprot:9964369-Alexandrium_andersonii.AAC.1